MTARFPYRLSPTRFIGEEVCAAVCKMLACAVSFCLVSCQKEKAEAAKIFEVNFYMRATDNRDSAVTSAIAGVPLTVMVKTNANMCTVWPAGDRLTIKSVVNPQQDSVDVYGHPVLLRSDDYRDYGLTNARGKLMTGNKETGYSIKYTYTTPGTYAVAIIAEMNGTSTAGFTTTVLKKDITVK